MKLRWGGSSDSFNFLLSNSVDEARLQFLLHEQLARRDFRNPDRWVSALAERVTVSENGLVYTVHLREDVTWHPPPVDLTSAGNEWLKERREVTAEDCAFFFELVRHPEVNAGAMENYYEGVESVQVIDKQTFQVRWRRRSVETKKATLFAYPLPRWLLTRNRDGTSIPEDEVAARFEKHWSTDFLSGAGPYRRAREDGDAALALVRNERYWGEKPPIRRIEYYRVGNAMATYEAFSRGEIDFIGHISPDIYAAKIKEGRDPGDADGEWSYEVFDKFAYHYVGWNLDSDLFRDHRVRRAMTHSLDRRRVIDEIFHGLGTIQTGPFHPKHRASDPTIDPWPYDLEEASRLLEKAGWRDSDGDGVRERDVGGETIEFRFELLVYHSPSFRSMARFWQQALAKIGVVMTPRPIYWPEMQRRMKAHEFDAFVGGWGLGWQVDPFQIWHSSQADVRRSSNHVRFRNDRADELIEAMRVTFEPERRQELAHAFHRLLHREQPYTFLLTPRSAAVWDNRVRNVTAHPIRPHFTPVNWYLEEDDSSGN